MRKRKNKTVVKENLEVVDSPQVEPKIKKRKKDPEPDAAPDSIPPKEAPAAAVRPAKKRKKHDEKPFKKKDRKLLEMLSESPPKKRKKKEKDSKKEKGSKHEPTEAGKDENDLHDKSLDSHEERTGHRSQRYTGFVDSQKSNRYWKQEGIEKQREEKSTRKGLKVFVGGVPFGTPEATLRSDFEVCGEITHMQIPKNEETGKEIGIAFITFATPEGVEKALEYDGDDYGGRTLKVAMATPSRKEMKEEEKGAKGKGKGRGKGKSKAGKSSGGEHSRNGRTEESKQQTCGKPDVGRKDVNQERKKFGFELSSDDEK